MNAFALNCILCLEHLHTWCTSPCIFKHLPSWRNNSQWKKLFMEHWMIMSFELEDLPFTDISDPCALYNTSYEVHRFCICGIVKSCLCYRVKGSAGVMHQNLPYLILQTLASGCDFFPHVLFSFALLNFPSSSFLTQCFLPTPHDFLCLFR